MKYQRIENLQTELTFGKHNNKTIEGVLDEDPQYIEWCLKQKLLFFKDAKVFNDLLKQNSSFVFSLEAIRKYVEFDSEIKRFGHFDDFDSQFELRMSLDCLFSFGKYMDKSLRFVAENDPKYIEWCFINELIFIESERDYYYKQTPKVFRKEPWKELNEPWKELNELIKVIEQNNPNFQISKEAIKIMKEFADRRVEEEIESTMRENARNELENELYNQNHDGDWGGLYGDEAGAGYWNTQ